jgi:hypothetical protein
MAVETKAPAATHGVVHYEIPATDAKKLVGFYGGVFGWEFQGSEAMEDYFMTNTGEDQVAIAIYPRQDDGSGPRNYVNVESVETYAAKIEAHGGQLAHRFTVPYMGRGAIAFDPEGNAIGIWQADPSAQPDPE